MPELPSLGMGAPGDVHHDGRKAVMSETEAKHSELVQEFMRLRAIPGTCPEALALIDAAIEAQRRGEAGQDVSPSKLLQGQGTYTGPTFDGEMVESMPCTFIIKEPGFETGTKEGCL